MIYTKRLITIRNTTASIDAPIVLYRGDKDVEIMFEIIDSKFKFESSSGNLINNSYAAYGQMVIVCPNGSTTTSNIMECENGLITFVMTASMMDELTEVGEYLFQIRLFNDTKTSRVTLPPVIGGIEVREPLVIEDDVENTDLIGDATVGYSMISENGEEDIPVVDGKLQLTWSSGDVITAKKLNAMVDAINESLADQTGSNDVYVTHDELNDILEQYSDIGHTHSVSEIVDLVLPTKTSQLTNDSDFATNASVDEKIANVTTGGTVDLTAYAKKSDIPTKTSQLTNDSNFISSIPSEYVTETELESKGYLTEHQDLSDYAKTSDIPTKTSELTNDGGYLTSIPSEYITETELSAKGYLTEHQDISGKADKSDIPTKTSQLQNNSDYATNASVDEKIANVSTGGQVDLSSYAKKTDLPTRTSQLTNDSNFISSIPNEYITESELNAKGYLTEHQSLEDYALKTEIPSVPTKTSQLTNDSGFINSIPSEYVTESELSTELSTKANTTDIPSLDGYATETYVQNKIAEASLSGGQVDLSGYATKDELSTKANVSHTHTMSNITDLIIPDVDKAYVDTQLNTKANKSDIPNLDGYALKTDIPTVPTKVSDLTNDSGYITSIPSEYITEAELANKGYLTEHQDISNKADKSEIPTKTSQLTNDSGFLTEHQNISGKADKSYVDTELSKKSNTNHTHDQYLTEHQDISGKADKLYVDTELAKKSDKTHTHSYNDLSDKPVIPSIDGLATKKELTDGLATKSNTTHTHDQYLTQHQDLSNYALKTEIPTVPTKTSQLTNDSGFITNETTELNILSIVLGNYQIKYNSADDTLDFLYNGVIEEEVIPTWIDNKKPSSSTGELAESEGSACTEFIPYDSSYEYTLTIDTVLYVKIYYYDSSQTYISNDSIADNFNGTITPPSNTAYMRLKIAKRTVEFTDLDNHVIFRKTLK